MARNKIEHLRDHLFATLEDLRDKDDPMELDRAETIARVASVIVESAKAESQYLKIVGGGKGTDFIPDSPRNPKPLLARPNGEDRYDA